MEEAGRATAAVECEEEAQLPADSEDSGYYDWRARASDDEDGASDGNRRAVASDDVCAGPVQCAGLGDQQAEGSNDARVLSQRGDASGEEHLWSADAKRAVMHNAKGLLGGCASNVDHASSRGPFRVTAAGLAVARAAGVKVVREPLPGVQGSADGIMRDPHPTSKAIFDEFGSLGPLLSTVPDCIDGMRRSGWETDA